MKLTAALVSSKAEKTDEAKSLDFSKCKITEVEDISFCISLRKLTLSHNSIKNSKSVAALRHLPSLTWLDLSHNELTEIDGVCQIQSLNVLNVSNNKIDTVSTRIVTMVHLQAFIATDNSITSVPSLPPNLDTIVISRNKIEDLGSCLRGLELLKKLSASHNLLRTLPDVSKCASLKELRLNNNRLHTLGNNSLIPTGTSIIDLGKNCLTTFESLKVIQNLPALRSLNISGNPWKESDISQKIQDSIKTLNILDNQRIVEKKRRNK